MVEIDVHPTTDDHFVVFHDWTVDCRTNGTGVTRELALNELQSLDIGYGYTADNGVTFPLRGKYAGGMPELAEFMQEFPDKKFLINFKSNDPAEGPTFMRFLNENAEIEDQIFAVYGGSRPTEHVLAARPGWLGYTKPQTKKNALLNIWRMVGPALCLNHAKTASWPFQQTTHGRCGAGQTVSNSACAMRDRQSFCSGRWN